MRRARSHGKGPRPCARGRGGGDPRATYFLFAASELLLQEGRGGWGWGGSGASVYAGMWRGAPKFRRRTPRGPFRGPACSARVHNGQSASHWTRGMPVASFPARRLRPPALLVALPGSSSLDAAICCSSLEWRRLRCARRVHSTAKARAADDTTVCAVRALRLRSLPVQGPLLLARAGCIPTEGALPSRARPSQAETRAGRRTAFAAKYRRREACEAARCRPAGAGAGRFSDSVLIPVWHRQDPSRRCARQDAAAAGR